MELSFPCEKTAFWSVVAVYASYHERGAKFSSPGDTTHRAKTFTKPAVLLEFLGSACKEEFLAQAGVCQYRKV